MMYKFKAILRYLEAQELYMGHYPTVGEIAKAVKMPKSTVRRLLIKLCGLGFVETKQVPYRGRFMWKFEATSQGYAWADNWKADF